MATRDERERERDAHGRLLVVQSFEDVQHRRNDHERDRQLPGAAASSPKTSREHDQRQPRRNDQRARQARNGVRSDALDQLHTFGELRRHGRRDVEDPGRGDEGGEDKRRALRGMRVRPPEQRAPQPDETGRQIERGHVDRGAARGARRSTRRLGRRCARFGAADRDRARSTRRHGHEGRCDALA